MKWPFRARGETERLAGDGTPSPAAPPEAGGLATDDDAALADTPASGPSRRRVVALVLMLALGSLVLWWLWGHTGSPAPGTLGPRQDPLLAVRPSAAPRPDPPRGPDAVQGGTIIPEEEPAPPPPGTPPKPRLTYYQPLPPRPESGEEGLGIAARQLVASAYQIALKNRETQLQAVETQQAELRAKTREAEAREAVARAKIKAVQRNPASVLRAADASGDFSPGRPLPPFQMPPPPPFPGPGSGPLVVPPKSAGPPPTPEIDPKASEIFVRMIDASSEAPEAMVTVGPASYVVQIGDPIGGWRVTGIGPTGVWITADKQRVWRPVLVRSARGAPGPPAGLVAAPAPGGHQ